MTTDSVPLVDLAPALQLLLGAGAAAALVLAWLAWRQRGRGARAWLASLTALTLFLTFDLIVFGSFTRLTDSGLGCPDWPGCYGEASPWGAKADIASAQAALPSGPVTFTKAWIEMIHRYLAMTVGALILAMALASWLRRRELPHSPWWPTMTLLWVIVQGLFGKYTVTLKLYPAIVTLHLLGGLFLLALLVVQYLRWHPLRLPTTVATARWGLLTTLALWLQIALGGWVSTNYAVLACRGFPQCNGQWWPPMQLAEGFELMRHLGQRGSGGYLSFEALVGIHLMHRLMAVFLLVMLLVWAWRLWRERAAVGATPAAAMLVLLAWQLASGLSNVVLEWPMVAALGHSAGAALLVGLSTALLVAGRERAAAAGDFSLFRSGRAAA
jgi:heme a synthase